jgi:hypothetical protein
MTPRAFVKWAGAVAVFVVIMLGGMLIRAARVQADERDDEKSKIQQGSQSPPCR